MAFDSFSLLYIALCFVLGGLSKGVVGMGLQTICIGLLAVLFDITVAMALLLAPGLIANLWQIRGISMSVLGRRLFPLLLFACLGIWFGSYALVSVDGRLLSMFLAVLLLIYTVISLSGFHIRIPESREASLGVVLGSLNGLFTGMTGSYLVPGLLYLNGMGLNRDQFIQAMGLFFVVLSLALTVSLGRHELITREIALVSVAACLPALIGMHLGEKLRGTLSDQTFRLIFFLGVAGVAIVILLRTLLTL